MPHFLGQRCWASDIEPQLYHGRPPVDVLSGKSRGAHGALLDLALADGVGIGSPDRVTRGALLAAEPPIGAEGPPLLVDG